MVSEYIARGIREVQELATRAYTTYQTNNWINAAVNTGAVYGSLKAAAWATGAVTGNQGLEDLVDAAAPIVTGVVAARQTDKITDNTIGQDLIKTAIGAATAAAFVSGINHYNGPSGVLETLSHGYDALQHRLGQHVSSDPVVAGGIIGGIAAFGARVAQAYRRIR